MPLEVLSYLYSEENTSPKLETQLVLQCAPFLKGLKISGMVNLEMEDCRDLETVLKGTEIQYEVLFDNCKKSLVFFYREKILEKYLNRTDVKTFLKEYGYEDIGIRNQLARLCSRIENGIRLKSAFPHEIGIFLGYPVEDVRGFIQFNGTEFLMTGYWKVYSDLQKSQMIFTAYDYAKKYALMELLMGKSIQEIAVKVPFVVQ